ncbi:MAG: NADPH-dependent FMN reductase [Flavisolibacter sp.]
MKIEIISGSSRETSVTNRLALHLEKVIKEKTEHDVNIIDVREHFLPELQRVFTTIEATPEEYRDLAKRMFQADGFILVSPEYNGSFSAAMKNLLDHFPKQHHKVFGIVTASPGALGGIRAAIQLQQLIFALFGIGSPYMLITPHIEKKFDEKGNLLDDSFAKSVDTFVNEYLWLAERVIQETVSH